MAELKSTDGRRLRFATTASERLFWLIFPLLNTGIREALGLIAVILWVVLLPVNLAISVARLCARDTLVLDLHRRTYRRWHGLFGLFEESGSFGDIHHLEVREVRRGWSTGLYETFWGVFLVWKDLERLPFCLAERPRDLWGRDKRSNHLVLAIEELADVASWLGLPMIDPTTESTGPTPAKPPWKKKRGRDDLA